MVSDCLSTQKKSSCDLCPCVCVVKPRAMFPPSFWKHSERRTSRTVEMCCVLSVYWPALRFSPLDEHVYVCVCVCVVCVCVCECGVCVCVCVVVCGGASVCVCCVVVCILWVCVCVCGVCVECVCVCGCVCVCVCVVVCVCVLSFTCQLKHLRSLLCLSTEVFFNVGEGLEWCVWVSSIALPIVHIFDLRK